MNPRISKTAETSPTSSATGATAALPVPTPSIEPTFAPGKQGPRGVSPRMNYSRVNTGAPPQVDAPKTAQKTFPDWGTKMLPKQASAFGDDAMSKITSRPMLQDLVKTAMANTTRALQISQEAELHVEKTASSGCSKCNKPMEKCSCGMKSASAETSEKLAAALDYLAAELLKEAETSGPPGVSEAKGGQPISEDSGQGHEVVPMHPAMDGTQMANDKARAPGGPGTQTTAMTAGQGKSASVADMARKIAADEHEKKETEGLAKAEKGLEEAEKAHESEPENKGEKKAFSVTDEGHKFDAKSYGAGRDAAGTRREARDEYKKDRPGLHTAHTVGEVAGVLNGVPLMGGVGALSGLNDALNERHGDYAAKKHEKGQNAYNPFGGMLTKTDREKKHEKAKEGSVPEALVDDFLARTKVAEDAINPAQIKAGKATPPETSASGQPGGNPVGGAPQGATGLVGSNDAAIAYNRGQAYAGRKAESAKYWKEPMMSKSTDKVLQNALEHSGGSKFGSAQDFSVKTAAARALLSKLAAAADEDKNVGT